MIRNLDDSKQISGYEAGAAKVFKGEARITGLGRVEVDGQTVQTDRIIIEPAVILTSRRSPGSSRRVLDQP